MDDDDLIPDAQFEETPEDSALDKFIKDLDIVDVYNKWTGKGKIHAGTKRESIKVSCPNPSHPDKHPSAWLNRDKNVWYCSGCDEGGDVYDIAAWHFGFPVPGYRDGEQFHKLREEMALASGFSFVRVAGSRETVLVPPDEEEEVEPPKKAKKKAEPEPEPEEEKEAEVIDLFGLSEDEVIFPTLPWRELVPEGTFLREYMTVCTEDDVAEEYHFWNGLLGIGFVLGKDVMLDDDVPVPGNLFICLLGHTGDGKSKSYRHLEGLLQKALPYKRDEDESKGVLIIKSPASAEALIHRFSKPIMDPVNPKIIAYHAAVRGLVEYNELSSLVGRASRQGNVIKPTLISFYDCSTTVSTESITSGIKFAQDPFASMFTTTQPRAIKELVRSSDADSGFLNRWVFVSGKPKERYSLGKRRIDTDSCIPLLHAIRSWTGRGKLVDVEPDAAERWHQFYTQVLRPQQIRDQSSMLTRVDLLLKKLFLLFAANEHKDVVDLSIVDRVIKMYPYIVEAYGIPAAQIGSSDRTEITEEILRHAERFTKKNKTGITPRDLNRCMASKKYDQELVNRLLRALVEAGRLEESTANKGRVGRPTVRYAYVG